MADIKDGGPAFPVSWNANEPGQLVSVPGMSLRDFFAGQALSGLFASGRPVEETPPKVYAVAAGYCYRIADAMLKARKTVAE